MFQVQSKQRIKDSVGEEGFFLFKLRTSSSIIDMSQPAVPFLIDQTCLRYVTIVSRQSRGLEMSSHGHCPDKHVILQI